MELIEIIGWVMLGFIPTLGFGNAVMNRFNKRKSEASDNKLKEAKFQ
jgi:hypothetical protein